MKHYIALYTFTVRGRWFNPGDEIAGLPLQIVNNLLRENLIREVNGEDADETSGGT